MKTQLYYTEDNDTFRSGELFLPEVITENTRKILLIHGGGWQIMDYSSSEGAAMFFRDNGFVVFNINYRLAPEHPWPACGDDCLSAADFLIHSEIEELKSVPRLPIFVCGLSAGGHLALMTGLRLPRKAVAGIISISGIAEPEPDRVVNPDRYEKLFFGKQFDPKAFPGEWLNVDSPPVLLTHYFFDMVVPIGSATFFAERATGFGVKTQTYYYDMERENEGHAIWIPGTSPRRLYPDIEQNCLTFLQQEY